MCARQWDSISMATKPNGQDCIIKEQIIEDEVTGLTIQIEKAPDGESRVRIYGDLPFGNRDFSFDADGELVGTGTATGVCPRPSWIRSTG